MSTHLSSISNTFFVNLLNRLGVRPPPPDGFDLINVVQPVSIVDSDIVLATTSSTQLLDLPFSTGIQVAPAANTVLADITAQVAGNYLLTVMAGSDEAVTGSAGLVLARRNAPNAADIWSQLFTLGSAANNLSAQLFSLRIVLQLNERVVVRVGAGGVTAGMGVQASIWLAAG